MYRPTAFREESLDAQHSLIEESPLGLLVTSTPEGQVADLIPFILCREEGELGTLHAHFSRANPQLHALNSEVECLVVFQGPNCYISPSWYETKKLTARVVPTWNYVCVQAWGKPRLIDDPDWIRNQIGRLTDIHESKRIMPWHVEDAPTDFVASQVKGIVGLEIPINRIEGKWKASQNRPAEDREGVVTGLCQDGADEMAEIVASRGSVSRD